MKSNHAICFGCAKRPARKLSSFCSNRCGAIWADMTLEAGSHWWCVTCKKWHGDYGSAFCPIEAAARET